MAMSLHGIVAYGGLVLGGGLLLGAFLSRARRWPMHVDTLFGGVLLIAIPITTTGMLAHCERVWRAAGVESWPPNLPWYRLMRDADGRLEWGHGWIAGANLLLIAALLIVRRVMRWRVGDRARFATTVALAGLLVAAVVSGARTARLNPPAADQRPAENRGWDDLGTIETDSPGALRAHILLAGVALAAGAIGLLAQSCRRGRRPLIAAGMWAAAAGAGLWLSTRWQGGRIISLLRQPRDLAHLIIAASLLLAAGGLLWAMRRRRRRWILAASMALAALLAAQVWIGALMLYDGSSRASPIWRLQRPIVQRVIVREIAR